MIKAILIDDEPLARAVLKEYLAPHTDIAIAAECSNGFEGVKAIQETHPDLIFLDVQMPKINGFEMLELLEAPPAVIFTTAFDEYALKAFEAHAVDYLLKPFTREKLDKAIEKFLNSGSSQKKAVTTLLSTAALPAAAERVVVKTGGKIKIIPLQDMLYLEAADDYVKIYTQEGSFLKSKTMGYFEQSLPVHTFVRVHRSYILNITQITRIEPYEKESYLAILKTGTQIPVSKAGHQKLKTVLGL